MVVSKSGILALNSGMTYETSPINPQNAPKTSLISGTTTNLIFSNFGCSHNTTFSVSKSLIIIYPNPTHLLHLLLPSLLFTLPHSPPSPNSQPPNLMHSASLPLLQIPCVSPHPPSYTKQAVDA
ncbi:unnamed protein product [Moneuplotes crassus]|uniref:Uncharacterized protein n=1 Tax=Euplotes crassus TaxID=5936 RepID=A0AAD1UIS8_EUPCR|nr:unnamed protein product [Moneuplotes crassus]